VVERSSEVNYTLPVPQVTLVEMRLICSELSVCDRIGLSAVKTLGVHLGIDFGALLLPYVCGVGGRGIAGIGGINSIHANSGRRRCLRKLKIKLVVLDQPV
jgi:hypothetical protein